MAIMKFQIYSMSVCHRLRGQKVKILKMWHHSSLLGLTLSHKNHHFNRYNKLRSHNPHRETMNMHGDGTNVKLHK